GSNPQARSRRRAASFPTTTRSRRCSGPDQVLALANRRLDQLPPDRPPAPRPGSPRPTPAPRPRARTPRDAPAAPAIAGARSQAMVGLRIGLGQPADHRVAGPRPGPLLRLGRGGPRRGAAPAGRSDELDGRTSERLPEAPPRRSRPMRGTRRQARAGRQPGDGDAQLLSARRTTRRAFSSWRGSVRAGTAATSTRMPG